MEDDLVQRIAAHPKYVELRAKRTRFGWILALLMLVVYYGFIVLVAFDKPLLATRMGDGVMTLGMPIGFGVIVFTVLITAVYVRRANTQFDVLSDAIARSVAGPGPAPAANPLNHPAVTPAVRGAVA